MRHKPLLLDRLQGPAPFTAVELRPPRSGLGREDGVEAWIDLHHALGTLSRRGIFSFLTDNAVGAAEEEGLTHVGSNVGSGTDVRHIVPILTAKHSLSYCTTFAARAQASGLDAIAVTGGDRHVGPPRCVPHGSDLRSRIRRLQPELALGGWLNPHRSTRMQLPPLARRSSRADFALTQIVSHHSLAAVDRFLRSLDSEGVTVPVVYGVFFYRSGNPRTLAALNRFFPVPAERIRREFERGTTSHELCARSLRSLRELGITKAYVSNLESSRAVRELGRILALV